MVMSRIWSVIVCLALILNAAVTEAGNSNSLMDVSADGTLLACSNRDSGTVTIVDLQRHEKLREVPVGHDPEGVSFIGNGHGLAVAVYGDDTVVMLNADTGEISHRVAVYDEPYGVVSSVDGKRVFVTLEYPGQVVEIDPAAGKVTNEFAAGSFPRGIGLLRDGRLVVSEYYTGIARAIDPATGSEVEQWTGSPEDNLSRQVFVHPTRDKVYLPHQRSRITVAHGTGSIFPYVSMLDTVKVEDKTRRRVQMDSFRGTYVVANPWEVAVTPDGKLLFVVFSGTDDMFVCNVIDDNYREVEYRSTIRTGANPRAVRVSPDGGEFHVYNAIDMTLDSYATESLKKIATVAVTEWTKGEELLLGKKLFYSANPPMTSRRWISCSSCHPDGDSDGRTWQQPEGLRNTQALFGMKHTHPIHWSADRDEVQDFEHTIRSKLMQGRGLVRGPIHESLAPEKNAGLSKELDAVAAYSNSHDFRLSPHARGGLSEAAQRGKEVFFSKQTRCAECHAGDYYTDQKLHDVGTGKQDKSELIGPKYDTPTLLGIYRTAPYLHHGAASTLEELLTTANVDDQHGVTSHLDESQRRDLIEFLKSLPYEIGQ